MSIPVQCTQEIPAYLHEQPQPLTAETQNPAAQSGIDRLSRNVGTVSDFLSEDMSKLCVNKPRQRAQDAKVEQRAPFLAAVDSPRCHGACPCEAKHPDGHATNYRVRGRALTFTTNPKAVPWPLFCCPLTSSSPLCLCQMPVTDRLSLGGDFFCQASGALMSDVALQSHICDFCQAVFPGHTTTRGEFLRHLDTHVT